jgi:hypothetical protein
MSIPAVGKAEADDDYPMVVVLIHPMTNQARPITKPRRIIIKDVLLTRFRQEETKARFLSDRGHLVLIDAVPGSTPSLQGVRGKQ